jgi:hypothetical protein
MGEPAPGPLAAISAIRCSGRISRPKKGVAMKTTSKPAKTTKPAHRSKLGPGDPLRSPRPEPFSFAIVFLSWVSKSKTFARPRLGGRQLTACRRTAT